MAFLLRSQKVDLYALGEELGFVFQPGLRYLELQKVIIESPNYGEERAKNFLDARRANRLKQKEIDRERERKEFRRKLGIELEEYRLKLEREAQEKIAQFRKDLAANRVGGENLTPENSCRSENIPIGMKGKLTNAEGKERIVCVQNLIPEVSLGETQENSKERQESTAQCPVNVPRNTINAKGTFLAQRKGVSKGGHQLGEELLPHPKIRGLPEGTAKARGCSGGRQNSERGNDLSGDPKTGVVSSQISVESDRNRGQQELSLRVGFNGFPEGRGRGQLEGESSPNHGKMSETGQSWNLVSGGVKKPAEESVRAPEKGVVLFLANGGAPGGEEIRPVGHSQSGCVKALNNSGGKSELSLKGDRGLASNETQNRQRIVVLRDFSVGIAGEVFQRKGIG